MVHAVPSQSSTSGFVPAGDVADPTATQSVLLRHDTALNAAEVVEPGDGALATDHALPFHCSTRMPELRRPTAAQKDAPTHETPLSRTLPESCGLGEEPHRSPLSSRMRVPFGALVDPVAIQKLELEHDTLCRTSCVDPDSKGPPGYLFQELALTVGGTVVAAAVTDEGAASARPTSTRAATNGTEA
jgi:hypothetical protein